MVNHQPESPISWVKCLKKHPFFPSRTYTCQTSKSNLAELDEEQKVRFDHDQWSNHDNHDWLVINLRWVFQMILAKGAIPNSQSSQQQNALVSSFLANARRQQGGKLQRIVHGSFEKSGGLSDTLIYFKWLVSLPQLFYREM